MGRLIDYFNHKYPYSDFHELNADWLISEIKELIEVMDNFIHIESITFADPITWNITTQYSKNTVVIDYQGNAYLSKEAVPAGTQLNNSSYWLEIFNFTDYTRTANQNLTVNIETNTTRATAAYQIDDWLIWNDILYKVVADINNDDLLEVDNNIEHFTVEDFCRTWQDYMVRTILQYKNDIDASEAAYRAQLAGDIAATTSNLQSQLNLAIAGVTVDSEVINARVGEDGITYSTLGDAIRTQFANINDWLRMIKIDYTNTGFITASGEPLTNNPDYKYTNLIPVAAKSKIAIRGAWTGNSSLAYAFYSGNSFYQFISGQSNITSDVFNISIPNNAKYVAFCSRTSQGEQPEAYVLNYEVTADLAKSNSNDITKLQKVLSAPLISGHYINASGVEVVSADYSTTDFYLCKNLKSFDILDFFAGSSSLAYAFYDGNYNFISGLNNLSGDVSVNVIPSNAVFVKFGTKNDTTRPSVILHYGSDLTEDITGASILIFGDSITDCCNLTIDSNNCTSAYTWKNPSNSYVNAGGVTIPYSMWPKILKESQNCGEIRNYARSGASYKTTSRTPGEERQNLQYQIDVALNDVDNPNGVFTVNHFNPDIIIFALGINDGDPSDNYNQAMSATVYDSDSISISVDSTIAALNDNNSIASARKAFLRIKKAFPNAQLYCVLPGQTASSDRVNANMNIELRKMANRYGCIIIDEAFTSGIVRDFNKYENLGVYLKDGLHPNPTGQNCLSRMIIASIKSHYISFKTPGFNS